MILKSFWWKYRLSKVVEENGRAKFGWMILQEATSSLITGKYRS